MISAPTPSIRPGARRWTTALLLAAFLFGGVLPVTPAQAERLDVVGLLDNSGSMRDGDPRKTIRDLFGRFVGSMRSGDRVALLRFDERPEVILNLTRVVELDRARLGEQLENVDYDGQRTRIARAVEQGLYMLEQSQEGERAQAIVLLTDGVIDTGNPELDREQSEWLLNDLLGQAIRNRVRIYGIAFTGNADFRLLQTLAFRTGGRHFRVFETSAMEAALDAIRQDLQTPAGVTSAPAAIADDGKPSVEEEPVSTPMPSAQPPEPVAAPAPVPEREPESEPIPEPALPEPAVSEPDASVDVAAAPEVPAPEASDDATSGDIGDGDVAVEAGVADGVDTASVDEAPVGEADEATDVPGSVQASADEAREGLADRERHEKVSVSGAAAGTDATEPPPEEASEEAVPLVTGLMWLAVALVAGIFVVILMRPKLGAKGQDDPATDPAGAHATARATVQGGPAASSAMDGAGVAKAGSADSVDYGGAVLLDEDFMDLDHTELTPPVKAPPDATTQSDRLKANLADLSGVCAVRVHNLTPSKPTVVTRAQRAESEDTRYLVIKQSGVSREHAVIEYRKDGFYVSDKGSTNGTRVNGSKVTQPRLLNNGDHLHFDVHEFVFEQSLGEG